MYANIYVRVLVKCSSLHYLVIGHVQPWNRWCEQWSEVRHSQDSLSNVGVSLENNASSHTSSILEVSHLDTELHDSNELVFVHLASCTPSALSR